MPMKPPASVGMSLAQVDTPALLIDLDSCGGGIDLLLGGESAPGLRWPDLSLRAGRLSWTEVRDALPRRNGVAVLSASRIHCDIAGGAAGIARVLFFIFIVAFIVSLICGLLEGPRSRR